MPEPLTMPEPLNMPNEGIVQNCIRWEILKKYTFTRKFCFVFSRLFFALACNSLTEVLY